MTLWRPEKPLGQYSVAELDCVRRRLLLTPQDVDQVEIAMSALSALRDEPDPWESRQSMVTPDGTEFSEHGLEMRALRSKHLWNGPT